MGRLLFSIHSNEIEKIQIEEAKTYFETEPKGKKDERGPTAWSLLSKLIKRKELFSCPAFCELASMAVECLVDREEKLVLPNGSIDIDKLLCNVLGCILDCSQERRVALRLACVLFERLQRHTKKKGLDDLARLSLSRISEASFLERAPLIRISSKEKGTVMLLLNLQVSWLRMLSLSTTETCLEELQNLIFDPNGFLALLALPKAKEHCNPMFSLFMLHWRKVAKSMEQALILEAELFQCVALDQKFIADQVAKSIAFYANCSIDISFLWGKFVSQALPSHPNADIFISRLEKDLHQQAFFLKCIPIIDAQAIAHLFQLEPPESKLPDEMLASDSFLTFWWRKVFSWLPNAFENAMFWRALSISIRFVPASLVDLHNRGLSSMFKVACRFPKKLVQSRDLLLVLPESFIKAMGDLLRAILLLIVQEGEYDFAHSMLERTLRLVPEKEKNSLLNIKSDILLKQGYYKECILLILENRQKFEPGKKLCHCLLHFKGSLSSNLLNQEILSLVIATSKQSNQLQKILDALSEHFTDWNGPLAALLLTEAILAEKCDYQKWLQFLHTDIPGYRALRIMLLHLTGQNVDLNDFTDIDSFTELDPRLINQAAALCLLFGHAEKALSLGPKDELLVLCWLQGMGSCALKPIEDFKSGRWRQSFHSANIMINNLLQKRLDIASLANLLMMLLWTRHLAWLCGDHRLYRYCSKMGLAYSEKARSPFFTNLFEEGASIPNEWAEVWRLHKIKPVSTICELLEPRLLKLNLDKEANIPDAVLDCMKHGLWSDLNDLINNALLNCDDGRIVLRLMLLPRMAARQRRLFWSTRLSEETITHDYCLDDELSLLLASPHRVLCHWDQRNNLIYHVRFDSTWLSKDESPAVWLARLPCPRLSDHIQWLEDFGTSNRASLSTKEDGVTPSGRRQWWEQRYKLEQELIQQLSVLQNDLLGFALPLYIGLQNCELNKEEQSFLIEQLPSKCRYLLNSRTSNIFNTEEDNPFVSTRGEEGLVILLNGDESTLMPWEILPALKTIPILRSLQSFADISLNVEDCLAVLNPSGDLKSTEQTISSFLSSIRPLTLFTGPNEQPKPQDLLQFISSEEHPLFLYFGHSAVDLANYAQSSSLSPSFLFGCSSAHLKTVPSSAMITFRRSGPMLGYLTRGSPIILGSLWDVTDRDIDKLAIFFLRKLPLSLPSSVKRDQVAGALRNARSVCLLPHLNGGASILYI